MDFLETENASQPEKIGNVPLFTGRFHLCKTVDLSLFQKFQIKPSPLSRKIDRWRIELREFPDKMQSQYVLDGLQFGFSLGVDRVRADLLCAQRKIPQCKSDKNVVDFLRSEIQEELNEGRMS